MSENEDLVSNKGAARRKRIREWFADVVIAIGWVFIILAIPLVANYVAVLISGGGAKHLIAPLAGILIGMSLISLGRHFI